MFNLSSDGHAACVSHMMSYGVPLMLLGGGGAWGAVQFVQCCPLCVMHGWFAPALRTKHCLPPTRNAGCHPAGYKIINVARCWARETGEAAWGSPDAARQTLQLACLHAL